MKVMTTNNYSISTEILRTLYIPICQATNTRSTKKKKLQLFTTKKGNVLYYYYMDNNMIEATENL